MSTFEFVDDVTVTEIINSPRRSGSHVPQHNFMNINVKKIK